MPDGTAGCVLAFDFGRRRTGVAVAETSMGIAHALETIHAADTGERLRRIARVVAEWKPVHFVVGMPTADTGAVHSMSTEVREFAAELARSFRLPVLFEDERFSSHAARQSLDEAGVRGLRQKAHLDSFAAKEILQGYLDAQRASA